MRHAKGSIVLSETQDHPILRQVLGCGFVTHDQLFRFMQLSLHERSRNSFNNRIRRLVKHEIVAEGYSPLVPGSRYYSIPTATAVILAGRGPLYVGAITGLEKRRETDALAHAIELNDIHLALAGSGLLIRWKPEVEIRAQNERTDFGHPKDYDAVVTLEGPNGPNGNRNTLRFSASWQRKRVSVASSTWRQAITLCRESPSGFDKRDRPWCSAWLPSSVRIFWIRVLRGRHIGFLFR
jgi:hypothetical protein